ncbi:MAG TPA: glycosyltransferase family 39 protein [Gemmata sp.]
MRALPAVLIAVHACLVGYGAYVHSPTRNEVAHVPAGLAIWRTGTFALYRVNPPLPRALASLPVLAADPNTDMIPAAARTGDREEWEVAAQFADGNPLRYLALVRLARLAGVAWSVLGAWLVWKWATELYGTVPGLLGLFLWAVDPTVNAHAQLATPDLPAAVAGLAAGYTFWRYLVRPGAERAVAAGLVLGAAQLCKFTLLVLYPTFLLVAVVYAVGRGGGGSFAGLPTGRRLGHGALISFISVAVINLGYLADGSLVPLEEYSFRSRLLTLRVAEDRPREDNRFRGTWLGRVPVPLPYDYVSGMDIQRVDFEGRFESYADGTWAGRGWWWFYLYALALKTPVGVLGLVALGLALAIRRPRAEDAAVWLPVAAVLVFVSSQTGYTLHSRYVLPALPFALVGAAGAGRLLNRGARLVGLLVLGCAVGTAVSVGRVYPHTLSYFNEPSGGPRNGWRHLADSNVDWGQDLLLLRQWTEEHPEARPLYVSCSHLVDPRHAGYEWEAAPVDLPHGCVPGPNARPQDYDRYGPRPGYCAVDVFGLVAGDRRFFQRFAPVDRVGYSIYIYRFTEAEARAARAQMGLPPLPTLP